MTNDTHQTHETDNKTPPFGKRLQVAREQIGLDRNDVAARLRLKEKFIIMMEKDRYPVDLPPTFIRGYLRLYGKFLELPTHEIERAVLAVQTKPHVNNIKLLQPKPTSNIGKFFMTGFTCMTMATLFGLVGMWWHTNQNIANSSLLASSGESTLPIAAPAKPAPATPMVALAQNKVAGNEIIADNKPQATAHDQMNTDDTIKQPVSREADPYANTDEDDDEADNNK